MRINIFNSCDMMGADAAKFIANKLNEAIREKGSARLLLSTGASQLEMFAALVHEKVDWSKVTMFHLDEYVGRKRYGNMRLSSESDVRRMVHKPWDMHEIEIVRETDNVLLWD